MTASRLLFERPLKTGEGGEGIHRCAVRSVTVNLAESPLGWLFARGFVTRRQFEAGERLRSDWERAELAPKVPWSGTPVRSLVVGAGLGRAATRGPRKLTRAGGSMVR
jgi:hypothetical protein